MKAEKWTFWFVAIFFAIVAPIYWIVAGDIAGTFVLGFSGLLGALIGGYLTLTARSFDARLEDRLDAEIAEGAGEYGFFSPSSIWPFWCAVTASLIFMGPATHQGWITLIGFGVGIWALSGWIFQYYRGDYKH